MNKVSLPLCLFGAALATANILIMQRPTCSSGGAEVAAADKATSSTQPEAVSTAKGKPAQAPKAASSQAERLHKLRSQPRRRPNLDTPRKQPSTRPNPQAPKAAAKPPAAPQDVQVTGSVDQTPKTQEPKGEKPASASLAQLAEVSAWPAKGEDKPEEWAEVSLAAKVHNAPSVSSPTVRLYRVGTRLKVIGREPGWIKVADPTTSEEGWIYEKYLTPKEGPDKKQSGAPQPKMSDDDEGWAATQPEPYARSYRPRKYGWRWGRSRVGFAIRVYPGW